MTQYSARPEWRAFFVSVGAVALAAIAAQPASAQFRAAWDANAAVSQFDLRLPSGALNIAPNGTRKPSRWLEQRALGAAFRFDRPLLQLTADGVFRDGDVVGNTTGGMSALLSTPSFSGWRFSASVEGRHVPNDASITYVRDTTSLMLWTEVPKQPSWRSTAAATLSYSRNNTGLWVRASDRRGANTSDSLSSIHVATGFSQQMKSVVIGFSVGSQSVLHWSPERLIRTPDPDGAGPDTSKVTGVEPAYASWRRFSESTVSLGWSHGRFAFDGSLSSRPRMRAIAGAMWGEASATAAVSSNFAFIGGLRTTAPLPGVMTDARRIATLGMRFAPPAFWRPTPPTPVSAVSRGFDVQQTAPGQYVFTINVPKARTVELAGDFTSWEAVTLRQVNATRWEVVLTMTPGSHRCNVRIDGAEWVPPPGVPTEKDAFNGRVGLFVAE